MRARMWMFQIAMIANLISWLTVVATLGRARWTTPSSSVENAAATSSTHHAMVIDDPFLWSTVVAGLILAAILQHVTFRRLRTPEAFAARTPHASFKLTPPKDQPKN